jgi:hypothetical protein
MASGIQGFIQTMLSVEDVQQKRRSLKVAERGQAAQTGQIFSRIFQTMNPAARRAMIQQYAMETGDDVGALNAAADNATMDMPTQQAQWAAQAAAGSENVAHEAGLRAATGMNSAEFAQTQAISGFLQNAPSNSPLVAEMLSSRLTGMNRAGVAVSSDFASRDPRQIRRIGDITAGLAPSWAQTEAAEINRGQLSVARQNAATGAFSANTSRWAAEQGNEMARLNFGLDASRLLMQQGTVQSENELRRAQAQAAQARAAKGLLSTDEQEVRLKTMGALQDLYLSRSKLELDPAQNSVYSRLEQDYGSLLWGNDPNNPTTPAQRAAQQGFGRTIGGWSGNPLTLPYSYLFNRR